MKYIFISAKDSETGRRKSKWDNLRNKMCVLFNSKLEIGDRLVLIFSDGDGCLTTSPILDFRDNEHQLIVTTRNIIYVLNKVD